MSNWQYWTGDHGVLKKDVWYLGIYKDLSGSFEFIKKGCKFYDRFGQIRYDYIDESLGYFIKQDIDYSDIPELTDEELSEFKPMPPITENS